MSIDLQIGATGLPFLQMWSPEYTLQSLADHIEETIPTAITARAFDGYHLYQEDHPEFVADVVLRFLDATPTQGAA